MNIIRTESSLLKSNMYILAEDEHAIIIDPCEDTKLYDKKIKYDWIILTHEHYDHISGVNIWKELTDAKVLCSEACAKNISNAKKNHSHYFDVFCEMQTWIPMEQTVQAGDYVCEADESFEENTHFKWQGHDLKLVSCQGHSDGSILIILDGKYVFSGDSILRDFDTECRFPGGSRKKWREKGGPVVDSLDESLLVYPGHFEEFYLHERNVNSR